MIHKRASYPSVHCVEITDLFASKRLPRLTYGVCPFCRAVAGRKIKKLG